LGFEGEKGGKKCQIGNVGKHQRKRGSTGGKKKVMKRSNIRGKND